MKVKDLIIELGKYDSNLRVVTAGFDETGYEDIDRVELIKVKFNDNREKFHGGRHKISDNGENAVYIDWQ